MTSRAGKMLKLVDQRELEDMHRWHFYEGGLDNRQEAITRLMYTLTAALKVVRCAEDVELCEATQTDECIRDAKKALHEALKPFQGGD